MSTITEIESEITYSTCKEPLIRPGGRSSVRSENNIPEVTTCPFCNPRSAASVSASVFAQPDRCLRLRGPLRHSLPSELLPVWWTPGLGCFTGSESVNGTATV